MNLNQISLKKDKPKYIYLDVIRNEQKENEYFKNLYSLDVSKKLLQKYPILKDFEVLDINYSTKFIEKNKIKKPVLELAKKMVKDGWLINKKKQWNKHILRLKKITDEQANIFLKKSGDAYEKNYIRLKGRIKQDRQYKLCRLQWEWEYRPCNAYVYFKDEISKLLGEIAKNHLRQIEIKKDYIVSIHPGVGVDLLIEAYHRYYSLDNVKKCPECHRKVLQTNGRGRNRIYCSNTCKIKAYRKRKRANEYQNKGS